MGSRSKTFIFVVVLRALVEYPEDHIDDPWLATDRKTGVSHLERRLVFGVVQS